MREAALSLREPTPERHRGLFLIVVAFALFLGATNAFDTGGAGAAVRYGYWLMVMLAGGAIAAVVLRIMPVPVAGGIKNWRRLAAIVSAIAGPELAVVVTGRSIALGDPPGWNKALVLAPQVLLVTGTAMTLLCLLVRGAATPTPQPATGAAARSRLMREVGGAELIALEAEDHYLRVHTDHGSRLILMSLSEAMIELEGIAGARTHRSWWVARSAVVGASRGNGRARLSLKNGRVAPVSRTYAAALRAAGFY